MGNLRQDYDYLKKIIHVATKLRERGVAISTSEINMLHDVSDYMVCLSIDALRNRVAAEELVKSFIKLQGYLTYIKYTKRHEHESIAYYTGFLMGLERLLSLWHEINIFEFRAISRDDFVRRWRTTSNKLNISDSPNEHLYENLYLELIRSKRISAKDLHSVPRKPGAYALWMEREGRCLLLKVGIAGPNRKDGIQGRIRYHFQSNPKNTVLARHMIEDQDFAIEVGYDFTQRLHRRRFLAAFCYFKILVIESLNDKELKDFEMYLENKLQPRYRGKVGGPYRAIDFGVCP